MIDLPYLDRMIDATIQVEEPCPWCDHNLVIDQFVGSIRIRCKCRSVDWDWRDLLGAVNAWREAIPCTGLALKRYLRRDAVVNIRKRWKRRATVAKRRRMYV